MKKNYLVTFIAASAFAVMLAGCGPDSSESYAASESYVADEAYDSNYETGDIYNAKGAYESYEEEADYDNINGGSENVESVAANRKLIKNVSLNAETKEFDSLINAVENKVNSLGGYVESSNVSGYSIDGRDTVTRNADYTIRIPSNKLDFFVDEVSERSNITSRNENVSDVTLEYSDVSSRIESLRIEQKRLNALLEEADSLDMIIELEDRLTDVRYEIESYESRLRSLDNQVDYATVYLYVREVKDYTPVVVEEPSFGERFMESFTESCKSAFEGLQDFIVWFVSILPHLVIIALVLGIFAAIIIPIVKAIKKSSEKKKALKYQKKLENQNKAAAAPAKNSNKDAKAVEKDVKATEKDASSLEAIAKSEGK